MSTTTTRQPVTVADLHSDAAFHVFNVAGIGYEFDAYIVPDGGGYRYAATISGGPGSARIVAETIDFTAAAFRQLCHGLVDRASDDLADEIGEAR